MDERLEIVNKNGTTIGCAPRSEIHRNPSMIHKVVHILVFNEHGELLLQKRSASKDIAPEKWDTSVGGHVCPAEDIHNAAKREMHEELGLISTELTFLYSYIYSTGYETEMVYTFSCVHNGPFSFNKEEIDAVKFLNLNVVKNLIGTDTLSGHFECELTHYLLHIKDPS